VGLTRAFIFAGTPSVIATLWNVNDHATGLLMEQFYTRLRAGGSKAAALQQAQQAVRKDYPHPFYWGAFVLTGDGGT
jgi:CHAT domain-containing protein